MRAVVLVLLFLTACAANGLVLGGEGEPWRVGDWEIHGAERVDPGPAQIDAYVAMSRCASADVRPGAPVLMQIDWIKADSIVPPVVQTRKPRGASLAPGHHIVIVREAWHDFDLSAHELLHQLIGPGVPHSDPAFRRCDPLYPDSYHSGSP